jgi:hypothetical protein
LPNTILYLTNKIANWVVDNYANSIIGMKDFFNLNIITQSFIFGK